MSFDKWWLDSIKEAHERYAKEEAKLDKAIQDMKECNEETDRILDEMYSIQVNGKDYEINFDLSNLDTDCDVTNTGE